MTNGNRTNTLLAVYLVAMCVLLVAFGYILEMIQGIR
jgi:hypothetical protein